MNNAIEPLFVEALFFLAKFEEKFFDLASLLRQLQEKSLPDFKAIYSIPQLGRRKAYYLVSVNRAFGVYPDLRERLMKVGWTRLSLVAPHVNVEDALFYCEFNSTWAIQQALKSNEMPPFSRFSPCFHDCPREGMMYEHELSRSALAQTVGNPSTRVDTIADLIKTIDVDDKMPLHKRQDICSGVRSLCWAAARQQAVALPFPGRRWRAKETLSHFRRHPAAYARAAWLCDQPTQFSARRRQALPFRTSRRLRHGAAHPRAQESRHDGYLLLRAGGREGVQALRRRLAPARRHQG